MRQVPLTISYINDVKKRRPSQTIVEDKLLEKQDPLEELFEMYKLTYKDWKESDKKPEALSIRLRKILSLMRKEAKKRRKEVQSTRYDIKRKKAGL